MGNRYHLILEDFEGTNSLSLFISADYIPREKEIIRFDSDVPLGDGVRKSFRGEYIIKKVEHEVISCEEGHYFSMATVRARQASKLSVR